MYQTPLERRGQPNTASYITPLERREKGIKAETTGYVAPLERRAKKETGYKPGDYAEYVKTQTPKLSKDEQWFKDHPVLDFLAHNPVAKFWDKNIVPFLDVQSAAIRKTAFGDDPYKQENNLTNLIKSSYGVNEAQPPTTGNKVADTIANAAGTIMGFGMPTGGGSLMGVANKAAGGIANKLFPTATKLSDKILKRVAQGAIESVPYSAQQIAVNPELQNPKSAFETASSNLFLGAGTELGLMGAGAAVRKLIPKKTPVIETPLSLPVKQEPFTQVKYSTMRNPNQATKWVNTEFGSIPTKSQQVGEGIASTRTILPKKNINPTLAPIDPNRKNLSFPQTIAKSDNTSAELKQMIKNNPLTYQPINNRDTLKYAQEIVDKDFDRAVNLVRQGNVYDNAVESTIGLDVIRRMQNSRNWDEAFDLMSIHSQKLKNAGQQIQTAAMWNKMTPEGMLKYAQKTITEANQKLAKKIQLTPDVANDIQDSMKLIQDMPEGRAKDVAVAEVLKKISDQVPVSAWRKISTLQAMSHLLNIKTFLRNILGNTSFDAIETISNVLAIPVDRLMSLKTGTKTVGLPQFGAKLKGFVQGGKESFQEVTKGIDLSGGSLEKYNVAPAFKKGIFAKGEKLLNYSLKVPDEAFKRGTYEDVLKQQMKLAGAKIPTQDMIDQATREAAYRTFQDNSLPARILQKVKETANLLGTPDFGAGDLLVKYTRVPGNIISRTVEYSPAGILKLLPLLHKSKVTGTFNQREFAMTISRAMTGTAIIGMGVILHRMGLLKSEDKERDKDTRAIDRAAGLGNYKVNLSGIERLLNGGSPSLQSGDLLTSYNWLTPVSTSFAIGAAIDQEIQRSGTPTEIAFKAGNAALEEILDLPTLSTIRSMTYQDNVFDVLTTPIAEGLPGFVPSVVREGANMFDPIQREAYSGSPLERFKKRTMSNIPLLRQQLEPRVSPYGEPLKNPGGFFNSFINPAVTNRYTPKEVTARLKELEDKTGEVTQYPISKAPTSVTLDGVKYELTPKEKTKYMTMAGNLILNEIDRRYGEKGWDMVPDRDKVSTLTYEVQKARELAKLQLLKDRGVIK